MRSNDAPVLQLANVRKAFGGLVAVDDAVLRCFAAAKFSG